MRTSVIVGVLVILLAVGAGWSNRYINTSGSVLEQYIDQMEDQVRDSKWEKAESGYKQIESNWENTKKVWSALVTHQEIDSIDLSLKRLEEFVKAKNFVLASSELASLRLLFEHIVDTEAFNLTNVF
ncbi:DUF4363 family protein [Desulfitobacterium sp. Sab5]|uniref:DUF4363 family protein n=1 Tax=Desulfitobacterium TaxID=36853 RepID=UPI003CE7421F